MKKDIGYRIRKLRESKDYSQENMGAELGITPGAYAKIERGETDPSATRLLQIAEVLGVDVYTFFHDSNLTNLRPVSLVHQPQGGYQGNTQDEIESLSDLVKKMNKEIEKIKLELASLRKPAAKRGSGSR